MSTEPRTPQRRATRYQSWTVRAYRYVTQLNETASILVAWDNGVPQSWKLNMDGPVDELDWVHVRTPEDEQRLLAILDAETTVELA